MPEEIVTELASLPYCFRPALRIALTQHPDGTWNRSMLTVPAKSSADFANVGTVHAVRRLLEYGWDRESPPLALARRALFRLLAEDNDPGFLYELGAKAKDDDAKQLPLHWHRLATSLTRDSGAPHAESSSASMRT